MGQAKQRGTYEQRKAEGIEKRKERERLAYIERESKRLRDEAAYRARAEAAKIRGKKPPISPRESRMILAQALTIGMVPLIATSRHED